MPDPASPITLPTLTTNTPPADPAQRSVYCLFQQMATLRKTLAAGIAFMYSLVWGVAGTKRQEDGSTVPDPSKRSNRFGADPAAVIAAMNAMAPQVGTSTAACFAAFAVVVGAVKSFDAASTVSAAGEDMTRPPGAVYDASGNFVSGWQVTFAADGTGTASYSAPAPAASA